MNAEISTSITIVDADIAGLHSRLGADKVGKVNPPRLGTTMPEIESLRLKSLPKNQQQRSTAPQPAGSCGDRRTSGNSTQNPMDPLVFSGSETPTPVQWSSYPIAGIRGNDGELSSLVPILMMARVLMPLVHRLSEITSILHVMTI